VREGGRTVVIFTDDQCLAVMGACQFTLDTFKKLDPQARQEIQSVLQCLAMARDASKGVK
jgi:hypothetical protein